MRLRIRSLRDDNKKNDWKKSQNKLITYFLHLKDRSIFKKSSTSNAIPRRYTAWLDTYYSAVIICYARMTNFVGTWKSFPSIVYVQGKISESCFKNQEIIYIKNYWVIQIAMLILVLYLVLHSGFWFLW